MIGVAVTKGATVCGPEAIDDLLRARTNYAGAAQLFVLTNAERFSRSEFDRAETHRIELIGPEDRITFWQSAVRAASKRHHGSSQAFDLEFANPAEPE